MKFKFKAVSRTVAPGEYRVYVNDICIGVVWKDDYAWSYAKWFIDGEPQIYVAGGVDGLITKAAGFSTRKAAARYLATMHSATLLENA